MIINGRRFYGFGDQKESAQKEVARYTLSSFTPEDMGSCLSNFNVPEKVTFKPSLSRMKNTTADQNKKKNKDLFAESNALYAISLLKPRAESVIIKKDIDPKGKVFYTDRGSQYLHNCM